MNECNSSIQCAMVGNQEKQTGHDVKVIEQENRPQFGGKAKTFGKDTQNKSRNSEREKYECKFQNQKCRFHSEKWTGACFDPL